MLNPPNGPRDRGLNALNPFFEGGTKDGDVPLPPGCPQGCLVGKAFLRPRHDEVEGGKRSDAGGTVAESFR